MMRLLSHPFRPTTKDLHRKSGSLANRKTTAVTGCSALILALASVTFSAQAQAPGKHVHGEATLDIAIEADAITLMLVSPLDNVLGFEHAPHTVAQRERVTTAQRLLASGDTLFTLDPNAGCKTTHIDARLFDEPVTHEAKPNAGESHHARPDQAHPHAHDHNHDHNDGHNHDNHTHDHNHEQHTGHSAHNDAELTVGFACTAATNAGYIDASPLFNALPRLQKLQVQIAGPNRQAGLTVSRDNGRILLKN